MDRTELQKKYFLSESKYIKSKDIVQIAESSVRDDRLISVALMAQFVVLTMQIVLLYSGKYIDTPTGDHIQTVSKLVVAFFFAIALPAVLRRKFTLVVRVYLIAALVYGAQYAMFASCRASLIDHFFGIFAMCLPSFCYVLTINDMTIFYDTLKKSSYVILVIGSILGYSAIFGNANIGVYNMAFSYYLLIPALVFLKQFTSKPSLMKMLLMLLAVIQILLLGARGPLVAFAVFFVIWLFMEFRRVSAKVDPKRATMLGMLLLLIIVMLVFFRPLITAVSSLLSAFGISSRTIVLLTNNELLSSSRSDIYMRAIRIIIANPVIGTGLTSDSFLLSTVVQKITYVHNLFLEFMLDYGVIFGSAVSIVVIRYVFRLIKYSITFNDDFGVVLVCLGFVPLMFSSTYLTSTWFWIMLGMAIKSSKKLAQRKHELAAGNGSNVN